MTNYNADAPISAATNDLVPPINLIDCPEVIILAEFIMLCQSNMALMAKRDVRCDQKINLGQRESSPRPLG